MWTKVCNDVIEKRTRKGLCTTVESKMSGKTHANYFKDYFKVYKYADQIATDALEGTATSMTNVNVDFTAINFDRREQVVKKGTLYMNVLMYAIQKFDSAIGKYVEGSKYDQERAAHSWKEGVALHVGNYSRNTGTEAERLYTQ